jgi:hypothetical protein
MSILLIFSEIVLVFLNLDLLYQHTVVATVMFWGVGGAGGR